MTLLASLRDQHIIESLLAGLIGGFFRGFSGFGFGMAAVPVLIVRMLPVHAIPAVLIHEVMFGAATIPALRKSIDWSRLGPLLMGSLIGTPVGLTMLHLIPTPIIRPMIGLVVLASVTILWAAPKLNVKLTRVSLGLAGVLSGLLNGSTAASGPPAIILLFASDKPAKEIRSLLIVFIFASAVIALAIAAIGGLVVLPVIEIAVFMVPGVLVGSLAGHRLFNRLHTRHYRSISLALLLVVSIVTLGFTFMPAS